MKKLCAIACIYTASLLLIGAPRLVAQGNGNDPPQLIVDDDKVQCPTAEFTRIQDAVNAAPPGAQIRVCPGIYQEQVNITKPLTIVGDNGAIVMPSSMVANSTNLATGNPIAAVILVADADPVLMMNLTVDGADNAIASCAPDLVGIYYRNASGRVDSMAVRNMALQSGLEGCQSGLGIFAQSGGGGSSRVEVMGSSVHDYQKNGITGNEPGTQLWAKSNAVTGIGPTDGAAQNGIQIAFGASGEIEHNDVANHIWSRCVSVEVCSAIATNILVFQSDNVHIQGNVAGISQRGISLVGNQNEADHNRVFDTLVFDGIAVTGDANAIHKNSITHSEESGIFINGNNNEVTENRINEAPIGVLKTSTSSGNTISGNVFFNTPIPVKDPPPSRGNLSPYR